MMRTLRSVLILDAAVLFVLGTVLIAAPHQVAVAFRFENLPAAVNYLIAMWGCALATMGIGYCIAATDPLRHVAWIQVGIARGALECLVAVVCIARDVVTLPQARVGLAAAGLMTIAYIVLYPRQRQVAI